jgi:hypothetical protein
VTSPTLFRAEAVRARAESGFGPIRIGLAPPLRWLALALIVVSVLALGWAAVARHARTLALPGTLRPAGGLLLLHAGVSGRVSAIAAQEGQKLVAGAAVAVIERDDPTTVEPERWVTRVAPAPTRVSALPVPPGAAVAPSTVLARLEPVPTGWVAELTAPAYALGALPDGLPLRLRLLDGAGSDPVWLDGRVRGVAREPQDGAPAAPPFYRVTVAVDVPARGAAAADLRSGLRVEAVLPLAPRSLFGRTADRPAPVARP